MSLDEANTNFTIDANTTLPSNYYAMVGEFVYGYSYSGTNIATNSFGDIDTYNVHLDIGSKYFIQASGSNIFGTPVTKANFALLDRTGKVLYFSYDNIINSQIIFTANDSLFYIQEYSDVPGMYKLRIDNLSIIENNGIGEFITYGKTYDAALDYTSDVDTYTAYLEAGKTYYFSILSTIPDIFLDIEYSQTRVASLATNGQGLFYFTAGYNGYYDLHISSNYFINTGKYTLITQPTLINHSPTGTVTITGTASQNQILIASNNLADTDGLGILNYDWLINGITTISGATGNSYKLTQSDVGKSITVKAIYTDGLGFTESVASPSTMIVANVNDVPTGVVTIKGTINQGQTLNAINTLADADGLGTITYQWLRDGAIINNAIYSTYPLTQADVGKAISVKANYTDLLGTAESVTSAPTSAVTSTGTLVTSITKVLLGFDGTFVAASNVAIFGNSGFETVKVQDGVAVTLDGNIERVEFARSSSSYTYQATPTGIDVLLSGNRVASVVNGEKLAFTNGSAMVAVTFTPQGLGFTLGGSTVSTTVSAVAFTPNNSIGEVSTLIAATPVSVTLNANSTSVTATSLADIFNIASGSYIATIANFKPGDKLKFFTGAAINVIQDNNNGDGYQEISATDPNTGATAIIALTGLTSAQDDGAFNVASFNTVFGSGSLV
jgi:hypothetical protein